MRSVLLMLMLSFTRVRFALPCPASCVVCSEDAIICNKLSSVIEAPDSTKALMLTDGLIDIVGSIVFSNSSNMSVLSLSNNVISTILGNAFQNLTVLRTLILDHNHISNQALDTSTFSWLHTLETLHLGNNALKHIDGSWFQSTKALKTLLLEGNLLTSVNSSTFASSNLKNLETLDLSDNLITYLGQNSFQNLPRLRSLDLSRNRLQNAPDAFSYLSSLSMLNLDLNRWNCTCQLKELAKFLNSYIQSPDRVLYNGQRMACVSSDNPAVQTVLELTDANCAPANSNITVTVVTEGSIKPQRYARDVAVTAVCSLLGGVGITLGIFAILYRALSKRLPQDKNVAEEQSSQGSAQWDFSEGKQALSMAYSLHNSNYRGHQPWSRENASYDLKSATVENHFICHNCSSTILGTGNPEGGWRRETSLPRPNHIGIQHKRQGDWLTPAESNQWKDTETGHSLLQSRIKDIRALRRSVVNQHHPHSQERDHGASKEMSSISMQQLALRKHLSVTQRQTFTPKEQMHQKKIGNCINIPTVLNHEREEYGTLPLHQTFNCLHCHQTYDYRQAGNENQFRNHTNSTLPSEEKVTEAILYRDSLSYNQTNVEGQAREQRSVTFDLSGVLEQAVKVPNQANEGSYTLNKIKISKVPERNLKSGKGSAKVSISGTRRSSKSVKSHKSGSQLKRKLKVKLNLNPLRRNRVQSTSSHGPKEDDADRMSIKSKKYKAKLKKDNASDSKHKSKKDKTSKMSPSSGSKTMKESKNSDAEKDDETEAVEPESNQTSSKREPSTDNDQACSGDTGKDISNDQRENVQGDSNLPSDGGIQDNQFLSTNPINLNNSSEILIPQTHSVSLMQNLDLQPLSVVTTDQQAIDPDLNLPLSSLEDISGPQEMEKNCSLPAPPVVQEYLSSGDGSPKRKIRLIIPEKTSNRPQTALEKKIR